MIVKPIHAQEGETIRIIWRCADDSRFEDMRTCPPRETRAARTQEREREVITPAEVGRLEL
jgi:hypothetical protein